MIEKYLKYKSQCSTKEIDEIIKIGKELSISQKTIATAINIFYKHKYQNRKDCESRIAIPACYLLACKINDCHRNVKEIIGACISFWNRKNKSINEIDLDEVLDMELYLCDLTNFEFNYPDWYNYLQQKCTGLFCTSMVSKTAWILLNDTFYLPFCMYFTPRNTVIACVFLAMKIRKFDFEVSKYLNDDIKFIMNEMLELYLKMYDK
ncbi:Cyclin-T1-4 [Astathelohania contejeani]|uniref:Cyclin-T1-4 n=1 Tax=Astathelohania contejeani TaxID=164912 RepID=A0ABQ7I099_9MICR|nr:Cyclin-T1-4 [Thelohania contejeani]